MPDDIVFDDNQRPVETYPSAEWIMIQCEEAEELLGDNPTTS